MEFFICYWHSKIPNNNLWNFDFFFFSLFAKVGRDNVSSNQRIDKSCQLLDIPCSTMMDELEARFNSQVSHFPPVFILFPTLNVVMDAWHGHVVPPSVLSLNDDNFNSRLITYSFHLYFHNGLNFLRWKTHIFFSLKLNY